jgi:chromosome segregation protein
MHLKRVELENFKSFGRKLTIPFLDGFTAITGPNGSGKSNIGDAVLFVLGPKSNKAIRAGKLSDLIFNGGKEKKPASECSVSLVFDNHDRVIAVDADEVALTRIIRKSRANDENYNSYFKVNGRPSSLTEFDDLLAKARISAEGYNIVRQGDVLRIVEMTPLQRRGVVDEIAGITRFDADIEKANKERAEVETNLTQIRIILEEIGRQLGTLEREREAALRYKAVQDELGLARSKYAKRRLDAAEADLANVHQLIEAANVDLADLDRKHEEALERVRALDAQLDEVEKRVVARAGPEAKDLKAKIDAIKRVAVQAEERLNHARNEIAEMQSARPEVASELKRQEKEIARGAKERDALVDAKAKTESALADKERHLAGVRDRMSHHSTRAGDVNRELAELRLRHEQALAALHEEKLAQERAADRELRLRHDVAESGEAIETERFTLKDVDFGLQELGEGAKPADLERLRKQQFELKKKEAKLSGDLRELRPIVDRLVNEHAQLKAQRDANEAVARGGGYARAVDAILTARDQGKLRGICGTIAELASVEKRLAVAMEVAAGGKMQAIVTETDEDAAQAIDFLKRNKAGRATFLPLNKMVPGRPAGKPLMAVRAPDAEGFALDLVEFDDKYRPAFWYVFRDTVVVKHLDAARKLMGGVRLVTLDGELIDAGGAMTGGEKGAAGGEKIKFGQSEAAQFEEVRKKLQAHVAHQEALSKELSDARAELESIGATLKEQSMSVELHGAKVADLERRKAESQARLDAVTQKSAELRRELLAVGKAIEDHAKAVARIQASLDGMEKERVEKGELLKASTPKDLAKELEATERAVGDLREKARDLASQLATRQTALDLVEQRRGELQARLAEMDAKVAEHESHAREYGALSAEKEQELAVLLALDEQHSEALRALGAQRDALTKERFEARQKAEKILSDRNAKSDALLNYKGRVPVVEALLQEVREELAALGVPPPDHVPESQAELKERVRALERQLEQLGSVNMLALDEFDRQAKRKDELEADVVRLETEREHLIHVVEEIVAKKKEGFFKVYDEINANFAKTYERLSNGGRAELLLENPESPFEGGLTMRAQPPGKKVTRLEALSGGEKSLTSMAFIFAIQEFDPSPFYYLDEVDQNLDGINSELLSKMVKEEAKHAQFIIVSLRKVTLKEAEHVYGVTMTESGLSEIIGEVRLSELADEPAGAPAAEVPSA